MWGIIMGFTVLDFEEHSAIEAPLSVQCQFALLLQQETANLFYFKKGYMPLYSITSSKISLMSAIDGFSMLIVGCRPLPAAPPPAGWCRVRTCERDELCHPCRRAESLGDTPARLQQYSAIALTVASSYGFVRSKRCFLSYKKVGCVNTRDRFFQPV